MPAKPLTNGTRQTEELERFQQGITRKLAYLPPGWETVVVKREARTPGDFVVRVQYQPVGRRCTVCAHPDRPTIDQMLVNFRPFRNIAERFGLSPQAIIRHHDDHLPAALAKAAEQEDVRRAIDHIAQRRRSMRLPSAF